MTIRERFWAAAVAAGLVTVLGEPTVLEVESEGEARASFEAPPPLLEVPPPPCDAVGKAAAEEARFEEDGGAMLLTREDSSWLDGSCCPEWGGENGEEVDDAADDLRLPTCLVWVEGNAGNVEVAGESLGREALGEGGLR